MIYDKSSYTATCPICNNGKNTLLYQVSADQAAMHFSVTHGLNIESIPVISDKISRLWNKNTAAVVACKKCEFVFADPFISGDQEFYNLIPHATNPGVKKWKWEFDKAFKIISNIATKQPGIKLLEIGASTGDFIRRIATIIPNENLSCIEYSEIGVNSIRQAGIEANAIDFLSLADDKQALKKFDIICLFQVLEHLNKIDEAFQTFNSIVKPDGHLFIGVPNGKKIQFNELNDALLDMPPNHIGRYNEKSFAYLCKKHSWQIVEIGIEPYTPLDVMKTVMFYQTLKTLQYPETKETVWFKIKQYIGIKYMRFYSFFMHRQLGETLFIHLKKIA